MKKFKINIFAFLLLLLAVILTVYSQRAAEYAKSALDLCAVSIIPSLFPYMVVSSMIVSSGIGFIPGKLIPVSRLFSLPDCSTSAILLGALCGFPVGAKTAVSLYTNGYITKDETEILISASNNTGPSFVVFVIGGVFFGSTAFGWYLYIFQLISSLFSALLINRVIFGVKKYENKKYKKDLRFPDIFRAVSDSATSVITVCAFIVFFCVIQGFLLPALSKLSPDIAGLASALLEFTNGARTASAIGGPKGRFLAGLSVGWSGLSVFFQTLSFTSPCDISLKRTVAVKALQGILCGMLTMTLAPETLESGEAYTPAVSDASVLSLSHISTVTIICFLLLLSIVSLLLKKKQKHLDL